MPAAEQAQWRHAKTGQCRSATLRSKAALFAITICTSETNCSSATLSILWPSTIASVIPVCAIWERYSGETEEADARF